MNLPAEWRKKPVGNLFDVQLGKMLSQKAKSGRQYPYLANFNVRWGNFHLSQLNEMAFSERERRKYQLKKGDLLMCEGGEIGRCAIWNGDDGIYYQKAVHRIRPLSNEACTEYLYCFMQFIAAKGQLSRLVGETSIAHLTREKLLALPIIVPVLSEQKAIAGLLSTWDKAIEKTERLVKKKEKQFGWLLSNLIYEPGKKVEEHGWRSVNLRQVCQVFASNVDKKTLPNEESVFLCNYMDVYRNYYITSKLSFMRASATPVEIERFQLKLFDVLLTKDSETPDDIANSACVTEELDNLLCGYHLAILRPKKKLFGPYLNFALHTPKVRNMFSRQANGATRFGITLSAYEKVEIPLPPINEQKEIVEILTMAQQEIEGLKTLVGKYKTQKRGLMQKILTGTWRVKR